jgi:hypothetical protein
MRAWTAFISDNSVTTMSPSWSPRGEGEDCRVPLPPWAPPHQRRRPSGWARPRARELPTQQGHYVPAKTFSSLGEVLHQRRHVGHGVLGWVGMRGSRWLKPGQLSDGLWRARRPRGVETIIPHKGVLWLEPGTVETEPRGTTCWAGTCLGGTPETGGRQRHFWPGSRLGATTQGGLDQIRGHATQKRSEIWQHNLPKAWWRRGRERMGCQGPRGTAAHRAGRPGAKGGEEQFTPAIPPPLGKATSIEVGLRCPRKWGIPGRKPRGNGLGWFQDRNQEIPPEIPPRLEAEIRSGAMNK